MIREGTTTQELISGSAKWREERCHWNSYRKGPPLLIDASSTSDKPACEGASVHYNIENLNHLLCSHCSSEDTRPDIIKCHGVFDKQDVKIPKFVFRFEDLRSEDSNNNC